MALRPTIHKAQLSIADIDAGRYGDHALTLARHPSETEERMMVRVLAYALLAPMDAAPDDAGGLAFGDSIGSEEDSADLWQRDLTGAIDLWVDVGLPDEKRVRRAAGRSKQVVVLAYGRPGAVDAWWKAARATVMKSDNVRVLRVAAEATEALAALAERTMQLDCTVQDGTVWLGNGTTRVELHPETLMDFGGQA